MKVPLSWLREYVDFDDDVQGLAEKLTFSGIEVEGIERVREGLEGVIVGEIIEVRDHPGADRLKICVVSDGKDTFQVVCGAPNARKGDKSAFAPAGTKLPTGIKIKKAKVRGEESFGMLCAEDELGLSDDHAGIFLVDPSIPAGARINDVIGNPDDVLDLEITWNRPDCLSIVGIAREVASLYGSELRLPDVSFEESSEDCAERISVSVEDAEACPRYTGRYLSGVKLDPSPGWMQSRLSACGIRPINNVVDITNYVLLETGHPLHAFDYSLVENGDVVVRLAKNKESIVTLDGEQRELSDDILLITDKSKPLAVAGVMGGAGTEISSSTDAVLLESATFAPPRIHAAVSELGLMSESSHRFERSVDIEYVDFASRRAAKLMSEHAGATVARGLVDSCDKIPQRRVVDLSIDTVNGVLGVDVDPKECIAILESLQFEVNATGSSISVKVPLFRGDITIEADLIEEIARMKGLDSIPAVYPSCSVAAAIDDDISWRREELRDQLVSLGLTETVNYSFLSERLAALMQEAPGVPLPNPVSADYSVMRGSLAGQMVDVLRRNLAHQNRDCSLFEIGKVFARSKKAIDEGERLCIGLMGKVGRYALDRVAKPTDEETFLWVKGAVEALLQPLGLESLFEPMELSLLEPGAAVRLKVGGKDAGWLGLLSGANRAEYRMQEPVAIAELNLSVLLHKADSAGLVKEIPAFPPVSRDIAVIVPEELLHSRILEAIDSVDCPELTRVELFDIFRGRGTGNGKKSMAYSFVFQASDRTLTDDEANSYRDRIRDCLVNKLNAEIREG